MFTALECVAQAVKDRGIRGLCELVPGTAYVVDIAADAYHLYQNRRRAAELRGGLAKVAAESVARASAAEEVARRMANAATSHERIALELEKATPVADAPGSPEHTPVADVPTIPIPRAIPMPLEGGAITVTPTVAPARTGEEWARAAGVLPGEIRTTPGESIRLTLHPDTTDTELAKLRSLSGLPGLEAVELSGCRQVTDAGVMHLAKLRGLKSVGLAETRVTDAGLKLLFTRFPDLEVVDLSGAESLTPAAIPHLLRLRKLKLLALPPRVDTEDVRADFRKRRPACMVL